jgi:GNAT superfamily N-acetyltransferase
MFSDENFFIWASELKWCGAGASRVYCGDGIVAFGMPALPRVWDANAVHLLLAEEGGVPALPLAEIERRIMPLYAASGAARRTLCMPYDGLCPVLMAEIAAAGYRKEVQMGMSSEGPVDAAPMPGGYSPLDATEAPDAHAAFLRERQSLEGAKLSQEEILRLESVKNPILGTRWFMAMKDGKPAARLGMFASEGAARFQDVFTLPAHRGRGLATALAAHATRVFGERGCRRFVLLVNDDGPRELYRRWGFRENGSASVCRKDNGG